MSMVSEKPPINWIHTDGYPLKSQIFQFLQTSDFFLRKVGLLHISHLFLLFFHIYAPRLFFDRFFVAFVIDICMVFIIEFFLRSCVIQIYELIFFKCCLKFTVAWHNIRYLKSFIPVFLFFI
jgi:hypothetical protein